METTYLTHTYREASNESAKIHGHKAIIIIIDLQRLTSSTAQEKRDTKALQISKGPPRRSHTVKGETAKFIVRV